MDEKDLPKIKGQMKKFVMYLANNCKSASEAYRYAYNAENMKSNTVWKEASKLLKHPKVTPWLKWIEENQTEVAQNEIKYNTEQAICDADELLLMALENQGKYSEPNLGAAAKFFELKNRLAGNFKQDNEQQGAAPAQVIINREPV